MKEPTASLYPIDSDDEVDFINNTAVTKVDVMEMSRKMLNSLDYFGEERYCYWDPGQAPLSPRNMEQLTRLLNPLNLHLDVTLGSANYLRFVDQLRHAFPATPLSFVGMVQPLPVLIRPTVQSQPPKFVDISMGFGNHVVYFSYNQSNLFLTAFKNRINGPWYELTLQGVRIKSEAISLMEGHYNNMQKLGRVSHDDMQFGRAQLENAVMFLSTRDPQTAFTSRQRQNFLQQCAKNLLLCIAYTSEAVRFSVIAAEIGGYMDNNVASTLVPHSPLLIFAWDRISRALIHAAKHENPEDNFDFILDPKRDFPYLTNFKDCADAMGVLNPQKVD